MNESDICYVIDHSVQNFAWKTLYKLFLKNEMLDISLIARNGKVSAHKIIMASVSTYMNLLLTSELTSKNVSSVDLSICDVETLNSIINYIYSGHIQLTQNNIFPIVELQDFLGLGILRHHLTKFLLTTINDANCWAYHELAEKYSYQEVFNKVDYYIRTRIAKLIVGKKPEFLNVSFPQLISFFTDDFLGISDQEQLLINLCEWMAHSPDERLMHLESLLSQVDTARIPSWRGMTDKLAACFPTDKQSLIRGWAKNIADMRDEIERKPPLRKSLLEVIFLIGGFISGEMVPSTDVFIPPLILLRVLPKSLDHKQLVIIPPMHKRRVKPTAVSTHSAVYAIGGTQQHEELMAKGIPCEAYRVKENKWDILPNLPQNESIKVSTNRRPPAAYAGGCLYAALPSPKPSFWILAKNETCWKPQPSPDCYEVFDLVSVNGAVYCIGREYEDSAGYLLERFDCFSQVWYRISTFTLSSSVPQAKGLCLENTLCVTSGEQWIRFDPQISDWKPCKLAVNCGEVLPSLCTYKEKQICSLRLQEEDATSVPSLELVSANGTSDFYLPGRSSAAITSVLIPVLWPEPI